MKLSFIFFLLPIFSFSQFKTNNEGYLEYEEVVQIDSLNSQEIHDRAAEWAALTYNDSKTVTKLDREDKIIINALATFSTVINSVVVDHKLKYSLDIAFKEGKYKIHILNLMSGGDFQGQSIYNPVTNEGLMSFEDFKKMIYKQTEQFDSRTKKMMLKMYDKDNYIQKQYDMSKDALARNSKKINQEIKSIAVSLETYIKDSSAIDSEDDW